MSDSFYVSVSSMKDFYSCHKKYYFRRELATKEENTPQFFIDGTHAHQAMEGNPPARMSMAAMNYYTKLEKLVAQYGYQIHEHEVRQEVEILPGVILVRIVDAIATLPAWDDKPVLLDFKTAFNQWKTVDGDGKGGEVAGKGHTFQAPGYLIPPDRHTDWPDEIHFLVAPSRGAPQRFVSHWNEQEEENFLNAVRFMMKHKDSQLMNRGIGCDYCPYAPACYNVDGWEDLYILKGNEND